MAASLIAIGIVAVGIVAVGIALTPRQPVLEPIVRQTIAPGDAWPVSFVVHSGDRAAGQGQLVARDGDPTRLCTGQQAVIDTSNFQYRCSLVSVDVRGIDVRSMPGARALYGAVVVDAAVVHGTWNGRALAVDQLGGAVMQLPVAPRLDCQYEVPGASNEAPQGQDAEAAYQRLSSQVYAGPESYAGTWHAQDGSVVVATTDELVATGAVLRQVFELPLCLVRVRFSTAELTRIEQGLLSPDVAWAPQLAEDRNRVLAWLPVLDDASVQALAGLPAVEPLPLLMLDR